MHQSNRIQPSSTTTMAGSIARVAALVVMRMAIRYKGTI